MLRNLLASYIDQVSERDLDYPLLALLSAMGYYDIHYTHGSFEFGKDFIAKKQNNGTVYQYTFQSKAGNIHLREWRANIRSQVLENATNEVSHPQFDEALPRQSVLITTGRLSGSVSVDLQSMNNGLLRRLKIRPVQTWERENLINHFEQYGLDVLLQVDAVQLSNYGNFLIAYARALQGNLSDREVQDYSCKWTKQKPESRRHLLGVAVESEMLVQQTRNNGKLYEAFQVYLGSLRAIAYMIQHSNNDAIRNELIETYQQAAEKVKRISADFLKDFCPDWRDADGGLLRMFAEGMMGYLVQCARVMELASISYFLSEESNKAPILNFIKDFIDREPGCGHIPSDRYTVTLVITVLALYSGSEKVVAIDLIRRAAVWLFDRYEHGIGLATFEADEYTETATLVGYAFDLPEINPPSGSFLATAIADLSCFVGNGELYETIINDIKALGIAPNYWQAQDTPGLFSVEAEDVVSYPNIEYNASFSEFIGCDFAEHIRSDPRQYAINDLLDMRVFLFLMLHLRDRYFPTMWPSLIEQNQLLPSAP